MNMNMKAIIMVILVVLVGKMVIKLWWKPRKISKHFSKQGITGPPYHFLIGNMKQLVELMLKASSQPMPFSHHILPRVLPFYHHWKKIYGATYLVWFGPTPRLTIADPSLIREIFSTNSQAYEKYESHPLVRKLEGNGLISLKGDLWAHRRKTISPIFHVENLKMMMAIMGKSVGQMLDKWSEMCNSKRGNNNNNNNKNKVEVEVSEWFQNLTEEVITNTIFGNSFHIGKNIFQLQAQQILLAAQSFQSFSFPASRWLPTKRNRMTWQLDREIEGSLMRVISQRKHSLIMDQDQDQDQDHDDGCAKDLLEVLIKACMMNGCDSTVGIRESDIVEECKSFFFAGKHTTSNLLVWATILLAMHPQWQQLARDEVLRVCGARDTPSKHHLSNLNTLTMIVYEVLRLYPPVVATIRRARKDVELGGLNIKQGTELLVPILAVHHDPLLWGPDASEFNPARFSQGVARAATHPTAFMPFGLGSRQCIGQNLALLQAKLTVAMILQRFSFELSPNYKHGPTVLMLLYPQFGAPITFRPL